jgi:hypothetical protein
MGPLSDRLVIFYLTGRFLFLRRFEKIKTFYKINKIDLVESFKVSK